MKETLEEHTKEIAGLTISYGIVQEHAVLIEVRGETGEGTTFKLVFPAAGKRQQRAVS